MEQLFLEMYRALRRLVPKLTTREVIEERETVKAIIARAEVHADELETAIKPNGGSKKDWLS